MCVSVVQPDIGAKLLFYAFLLEVHKEDAVHGFQVELPVNPSFALAGNGASEIVDGPFAKESLASVLHLYDELLPVFIGAVNIVDAAAVFDGFALNLFVQETDVADVLFACKETVEEIYQQVFVDFLSKDAFEANIGEWVDEFRHGGFSFFFLQR